jgi:hypothetical protein
VTSGKESGRGPVRFHIREDEAAISAQVSGRASQLFVSFPPQPSPPQRVPDCQARKPSIALLKLGATVDVLIRPYVLPLCLLLAVCLQKPKAGSAWEKPRHLVDCRRPGLLPLAGRRTVQHLCYESRSHGGNRTTQAPTAYEPLFRGME